MPKRKATRHFEDTYRWPLKQNASPQELLKLYRGGFPACWNDPAATETVLEDPGIRVDTFADACPHLKGIHKRRPQALHFLSQVKFDRVPYEGERQPTGNCVARGSQSARATVLSVETHIKGEVQGYERPAWESTYRARGHRGAGMNPAAAARCDTDKGFLWRRKYPFADLRRQNASWGMATGFDAAVLREMDKHHVGRWVHPTKTEEALDLLAAGYCCHSGQQCGFASRPNSKGTHSKSGSWNHDMATVGYDLSKSIWPVEVVFVPNSWSKWNLQPSRWPKEWGKPIDGLIICELDVWARSFVGSRSMFFYADIDGVPAKKLPDYGFGGYLG